MTYREKLEQARKQALDILSLVIAQELDESPLSVSLNPEQFEEYCSIINDVYISTSCPVADIIDVINDLTKENKEVSVANIKDLLYTRGF